MIDRDRWNEALKDLSVKHDVPGAVLGVVAAGERVTLASGVVNVTSRVRSTADAVFPIASISKVWTATVVMRLVERGSMDLDAPISDLLPEVDLPIRAGEPPITLRHLLTHTSGLDGDHFVDTSCGADALELYAKSCSELYRIAPPATVFSYGNAGFNLAGRAIERATGVSWNEAMRAELFDALQLRNTVTLPRDALLYRVAVGHLDGRPASSWPVARSAGPAGGILCSVGDLLTFTSMHLSGGIASDGTRVLTEASVAEMQRVQTSLPDERIGAGWGIGWMILDWQGHEVIGHDGGGVGIAASLRVLPQHGTVLALMANGSRGDALCRDLFAVIVADLHGIQPPSEAGVPDTAPAVDLEAFVGTYLRSGWRLEMWLDDHQLLGTMSVTEPISTELGTDKLELEFQPVDDVRFIYRQRGSSHEWSPVAFLDLPHGRFVHMWSRTAPKITLAGESSV